ncbi:uncharacterized protein LOC110853141 [Folsomia candida]|nr:uncharacterized protein LOC110853141 [Folsomia candida]
MDACRFDFKVTDSDFDIHGEKAGQCEDDKRDWEEDDEEEEEGDDEEADGEEEEFEEEGSDGYNLPQQPLESGDNWYNELNPLYRPPLVTPQEQYYEGLGGGQSKQFRTDYPAELRLKKVCIPKAPRRFKTVDNYKTDPVASFSPVSSKIRLAPKKREPSFPSQPVDPTPTPNTDMSMAEPPPPPCQKTARDPPPIVSVSDEIVVSYLQDHNIQMMFEYFLGLCILNTPADPFQYIADLADKLARGRESEAAFNEIPRLLSATHVKSMFRLYDRVGSGFMSHFQYKNAMGSIGLVKYTQNPSGYLNDEITQETFVTEAEKWIDDLLRTFLFKRGEDEPQCF